MHETGFKKYSQNPLQELGNGTPLFLNNSAAAVLASGVAFGSRRVARASRARASVAALSLICSISVRSVELLHAEGKLLNTRSMSATVETAVIRPAVAFIQDTLRALAYPCGSSIAMKNPRRTSILATLDPFRSTVFIRYFFHLSIQPWMTFGLLTLHQPTAGSGESAHAFTVSVKRFPIAVCTSFSCSPARCASY